MDEVEAASSDISDGEYYTKRMKRRLGNEAIESTQQPVAAVSCSSNLNATSRLFLRNLSYTITVQDIQNHFSPVDPSCSIHLPVDKITKRGTGIAYVNCSDVETAARALEQLDKTSLSGRLLHIMPAAEVKGSKTFVHTVSHQQIGPADEGSTGIRASALTLDVCLCSSSLRVFHSR